MNTIYRCIIAIVGNYLLIMLAIIIFYPTAQADEFYDVYEPEDQWVEISEPSSDGVVDVLNIETGELTQEEVIQVTPYSDITEVQTLDTESGEINIWGRDSD